MSATGRIVPDGEPCPVCGVTPFGANAAHGCRGCEIREQVGQRISSCFARVLLRHGRRYTPEARKECEEAALRVVHDLLAEHGCE